MRELADRYNEQSPKFYYSNLFLLLIIFAQPICLFWANVLAFIFLGIFYGTLWCGKILWKIEIAHQISEMHLRMHYAPTLWRTK